MQFPVIITFGLLAQFHTNIFLLFEPIPFALGNRTFPAAAAKVWNTSPINSDLLIQTQLSVAVLKPGCLIKILSTVITAHSDVMVYAIGYKYPEDEDC